MAITLNVMPAGTELVPQIICLVADGIIIMWQLFPPDPIAGFPSGTISVM